MEKKEVWAQYDRIFLQIREENRELYYLYSFFFAIESALVGLVYYKNVMDTLVYMAGLIISILCIFIIFKQRRWRDYWIKKLGYLENILNLDRQMRTWKNPSKKGTTKIDKKYLMKVIFGKGSLIIVMFLLPIALLLFWAWKINVLLFWIISILLIFWRIFQIYWDDSEPKCE